MQPNKPFETTFNCSVLNQQVDVFVDQNTEVQIDATGLVTADWLIAFDCKAKASCGALRQIPDHLGGGVEIDSAICPALQLINDGEYFWK